MHTKGGCVVDCFLQVGRKRKALAKDDSEEEEEWSPVKRKRVARATKAKPKRTTAKKKSQN